MSFVKGSAFRIYSNTGTIATPSYTALSCEGQASVSVGNSTTDTSSKCDVWDTHEILHSNWSVSGSGYYSDGDAGVDELVDAVMTRTKVLVQIKTLDAKIFSGNVTVESFDFDSPHDGVVGFSVSLKGDSTLTFA